MLFNFQMKRFIHPVSCVLLLCALLACGQKQQKKSVSSPRGYDLGAPQVMKMPAALREISGITFVEGDPSTILAEQDEDGILFLYHQRSGTSDKFRFGKKGDYEDVTFYKGRTYVLRSDGTILCFRFDRGLRPTKPVELDGLVPKGEYEGLFADDSMERMYVLCKECPDDKKSGSATVHILSIARDGSLYKNETRTISLDKVPALKKGKKFNLRPSALAKSPSSGDWYILSSVNKVLLVADEEFSVREVYKLDPSVFPQPEGIAFDNMSNLYISSEGTDQEPGTILRFDKKAK